MNKDYKEYCKLFKSLTGYSVKDFEKFKINDKVENELVRLYYKWDMSKRKN